ncbi:MAG: proline racemase family protein [Proteobacteria bacterium]|nr:proline racemase family protein [Pseudomonadota bacterium]
MRVIDSHTEGEPTRLIIEGGPDLGSGPLPERRARFARDFDHIRSFVCNEPRGFDALVGGLIVAPTDPTCVCGIIYFNNATMLGMCGHGTIGLAVTLAHLGRIGIGHHRVETPVGLIGFDLIDANTARITNVPSYRLAKGVSVDVPGLGLVVGDIAWGGNWFFLTEQAPCPVDTAHLAELTAAASAIEKALAAAGHRGADGGAIDHVEIFAAPRGTAANSRSFVLCSGGAYDRSPCGTGTSAKLACLAADGKLAPGAVWVQESVIGSRFEAHYQPGEAGMIIPSIQGRAFITGEAVLIAQPGDPFAHGIRTG